MAKDVLRSEGNLNNSSCSDERVVLHSSLISHRLVCPETFDVEERQAMRFIQGMDFQMRMTEGRTATCRVLVRVKADHTEKGAGVGYRSRGLNEGKVFQ